MPKITMEWQRFDALSSAELYEMLRFRQSIFVVEQRSPYPDLDGLDQTARHLLLRADGALAGYLRLIPAPLQIGRVAVVTPLRRRGLGRTLMEEALGFCRQQCPAEDVTLAAQAPLVPFYMRLGFVMSSHTYRDYGVEHVDMRLRRTALPGCGGLIKGRGRVGK